MTPNTAAQLTIQRVNAAGDDYENVRPASSRSNGRRDVRKLAERTGVAHRLVVGDGWDYDPEVVLVAGDPTAAEITPVAEETPAGFAPDGLGAADDQDAYLAARAEEEAVEAPAEQHGPDPMVAWLDAEKPKVDHVARHAERTARGPMLQSRYLGQDEWADVRTWDCLYRGRRGGRGLVKAGQGAQEARLVRQDTGEVMWASADDPELGALYAAEAEAADAAAAERAERSYLGAR